MTRVTRHHTYDLTDGQDDLLDRLRTPRNDVVGEVDAGDGRFILGDGPFTYYERRIEVDGSQVHQTLTFELPPGTWRFLMNRVMARTLRRPPPVGPERGRIPWWAPPQRPDPAAAEAVGLLTTLALIVGYHGTLLSQTMTFAADEFGVGTTTEGNVLALARIGGVLAVTLTALADRRGRRVMLLIALLICIVSTALGAVTPNLAGLAVTQIVNRGGWSASFVLVGIIVAEEMPRGARAYAVSLLGAFVAIGAGLAVVVLPFADLGERGWRILYGLPLLMIPVVVRCCRLLPESRRFRRQVTRVSLAGHGARLWLMASAMLLLNIFIAPQTQLRNDYLDDERGFSATTISLFVLLVSAPGAIGLVAGGRLADTVGRRVVGAISVALGTTLLATSFALGGPPMWLAATAGSIVFAAHAPSVMVYGPELFPTSLRGRANGIISITAMTGSVIGLAIASRLADNLSYGPAMYSVAIGPLLMAVLILLRFPETARRELEDINPEDRSAVLGKEMST